MTLRDEINRLVTLVRANPIYSRLQKKVKQPFERPDTNYGLQNRTIASLALWTVLLTAVPLTCNNIATIYKKGRSYDQLSVEKTKLEKRVTAINKKRSQAESERKKFKSLDDIARSYDQATQEEKSELNEIKFTYLPKTIEGHPKFYEYRSNNTSILLPKNPIDSNYHLVIALEGRNIQTPFFMQKQISPVLKKLYGQIENIILVSPSTMFSDAARRKSPKSWDVACDKYGAEFDIKDFIAQTKKVLVDSGFSGKITDNSIIAYSDSAACRAMTTIEQPTKDGKTRKIRVPQAGIHRALHFYDEQFHSVLVIDSDRTEGQAVELKTRVRVHYGTNFMALQRYPRHSIRRKTIYGDILLRTNDRNGNNSESRIGCNRFGDAQTYLRVCETDAYTLCDIQGLAGCTTKPIRRGRVYHLRALKGNGSTRRSYNAISHIQAVPVATEAFFNEFFPKLYSPSKPTDKKPQPKKLPKKNI